LRTHSIGASYGASWLAAQLVSDEASIDRWNPVDRVVTPDPAATAQYDAIYELYRELYTSSLHVAHALAAMQHR
jgi:sugar (pentulose or hexulose) kinase